MVKINEERKAKVDNLHLSWWLICMNTINSTIKKKSTGCRIKLPSKKHRNTIGGVEASALHAVIDSIINTYNCTAIPKIGTDGRIVIKVDNLTR